ncbi:MAG TPA: hypothetical protein VK400_07215 [Pyrinomonadaceae bacterium]|nr:hypothetical protein [Pyrinomonadaceae bacterium]
MAVAQSGHGNVAAGDKSAGKAITFLLPLTTPSVPEKFEFRALHVLKNQRVG